MRDVISDLLAELAEGPRNFYDLEDRLIELGHDLGDDPDAALEVLIDSTERLVELDDATVLDPHTLLSGVTFTVDFSESHDLVDHQVDLALVELLAESQLPLVIDGEAAGVNTHDKGYRLHHQRWLHLTQDEVLTGFTVEDGELRVDTQVDEPEIDDQSALMTVLRRIADAFEDAGAPVEVEPLLMEIAAKGVLTGTLLPFTELFERVGLETENMLVVKTGFDWDAWFDAQAQEFEAEYGDEGGVL